jgi:16S rRNA (adenine1518-N6/adenine1519-N6)-dimethyltransferase
MRRFSEVGIRPKTKHGQNFLIDGNLLRVLVEAAQLSDRDVILEVGSGTGALTAMFAAEARAVVSVEIDPQLAQLAREELGNTPNVTLLEFDALKSKHRLQPELIETVQARLAEEEGLQFKLAANLPYNIATPLISNLLESPIVPVSMTVTIQKELADRIAARPGTKDYSALSIWVQAQASVHIVRLLPPSVFWPRPKVSSAIIHIVTDFRRRRRIPDIAYFHGFVRAMFFHRRKFLRSVLISACKDQLTKPEVDEILNEQELDPMLRAEQLDVRQFLSLCEAVRARMPELPK